MTNKYRLKALALMGAANLAGVSASWSEEAPSMGLEEIVVTAQKVQQNLQRVSADITTIAGRELEVAGVQQATDLNRLVPGVEITTPAVGQVALFIRGVGGLVVNPFADPGNSFSLDQIYYSRATGPSLVFFDIDRVEVLKGPQGTLYGRNSTGGAFNVISRKPADRFEATVTADFGNYDARRFEGAVNLPVSPALAFRVAGQSIRHEGYFSDGYDDGNTDAGRVHALLKPSDRWSLLVSGDFAHQGGRGAGFVPHGPDPQSTPFPQPIDPNNPARGSNESGRLPSEWVGNNSRLGPCTAAMHAYIQSQVIAGGDSIARNGGAGCDGSADNKVYGASADLEVNWEPFTWSTIAGYRKTLLDTYSYVGADPSTQRSGATQTTMETRVASVGDSKVKWIAGAFYLKENQQFFAHFKTTPSEPVPPGFPVQSAIELYWPNVSDRSLAVFGQTTISLADPLRLIAGVRYTDEKKFSHNTTQQNYAYADSDRASNDLTEIPLGGPLVISVDQKFHATNYRAGLEYDVAKESMLYSTVSTGFHAGGLIPGANDGPAGVSSYKAETITAYAIGLKSRFWNDRLQINVEAYDWQYKDLQVQDIGLINTGLLAPLPETAFGLRTDNAGKATIRGLDTDFTFLLTRNDVFRTSVLYSHSKYDSFVIPNPFGVPTSASGYSLANAPSWSGTVSYQHTVEIGSGKALLGLQSSLVEGHWLNFIHYPGDFQEGYSNSTLTLGYSAENDRWNITAYVRNLENHAITLFAASELSVYGDPFVSIAPPRTYGAMVTVNF